MRTSRKEPKDVSSFSGAARMYVPTVPEFFHHCFDALADHIAILDQNGVIVMVNSSWMRFAEQHKLSLPDHGVGSNYLHFCDVAAGEHSEEAACVADGIRRLIKVRGGVFSCEYPCHDSFEKRWFRLRASGFEYGAKWYVVLSHQPVTEYKQSQEAQHQRAHRLERDLAERTDAMETTMLTLSSLAQSLAHDLRAPLRAIHGFAFLLGKDYAPSLDRQAHDYLERICSSSERLDRLTQDLLALARVSSRRPALSIIRPEAIIHQVVFKLRGRMENVDAAIQIVPPFPPVRGDERLIEQALCNLISNALKFRLPGLKPQITINATVDRRTCRLQVRDNGIGIAVEDHPKVFQPFQRLHAGYSGTGLGLIIAQQAAALMRGKISFESAPGKGSTFSLDLETARVR